MHHNLAFISVFLKHTLTKGGSSHTDIIPLVSNI